MTLKKVMALISIGALLGAAGAATAQQSGLSALDKMYLANAAQSNLMEIQLKPLVLKRAHKFATKDYARYLARDHAQMNRTLIALVARKGFTLPSKISSEQSAILQRLASPSEKLFDAAYKHEMIRDHREDIARARREISLGHDREARAYARKQLGYLNLHLGMAYSLPGFTPHTPSAAVGSR